MQDWLRNILACPACHSNLVERRGDSNEPQLVCSFEPCGKRYGFDGDIPVLIIPDQQ